MAVDRWIVPLEGHAFDVEDVPLWLAGGELHAVVMDGETCLSFPAKGVDEDMVLDRAEQLLAALNGIASLLDPSHRPLTCSTKFYAIDGSGQRVGTTIAVGCGEVRAKGGAVGLSVNGVLGPDHRSGAALPFLAAAEASREAADALTLIGRRRPTWSELSVVREIVYEASAKKMIKLGWISEADDERFTHTANNRRVLGIEARHGHANWKPPKNPMSYDEALMKVRTLVANWLRSPLSPSAARQGIATSPAP
jgi:hypothetical protein